MKHSPNGKQFKNKVTFVTPMLVCSLLHLSPVAAQSPEFDDSRENGPFDQRYFARIKGEAPKITLTPTPRLVRPTVDLISTADGLTNEVIVLLQYDQIDRLRPLLGTQGRAVATAPDLERAVLSGLQNKSNAELIKLFQGPLDSRYLLVNDRMPDAARERNAKSKSPRERLERFMVLRYATVAAAQTAAEALSKEPSIASASLSATVIQSFTPNDPYFPPAGSTQTYPKPYYQWGLTAMNFPAAWDKARGQAQIGVMDTHFFGNVTSVTPPTATSAAIYVVKEHPDLALNSRQHFIPGYPFNTSNPATASHQHTIHVAGIIAAQSGNLNSNEILANGKTFKGGTSGGCIGCSITAFPFQNIQYTNWISNGLNYNTTIIDTTTALTRAVDSGMQIINWSGSLPKQAAGQSLPGYNCPNQNDAFCTLLEYMTTREVLMPVATGNYNQTSANLNTPLRYSNLYSVLPVGGTEIFSPQPGTPGARWYFDVGFGASEATIDGVVAPAKSIVSSYSAGQSYNFDPSTMCGDIATTDESSGRYPDGVGDGVGSCSGTSMAAPHISALAGLIRSVNPRLTALETRSIIQNNGNQALNRTAELGYGMPNALTAVNAAISTNPSKLTPLFSFYSGTRSDSFYTTIPQMGGAALAGLLMPRKSMGTAVWAGTDGFYAPAYGAHISVYPQLPGFPADDFTIGEDFKPRAQVWLFTTHVNPKNSQVPLTPIYRMSWKCRDTTPYYPTAICSSTSDAHMDTVLLMESEVAYFKSLGYKIDGLEGYAYPKSLPQPAGTVRLIRKYHPERDDHAIFPETAWPTMQAQGYTANTNTTDWLGYVYPNTTGSIPTIQ